MGDIKILPFTGLIPAEGGKGSIHFTVWLEAFFVELNKRKYFLLSIRGAFLLISVFLQ